MRDRLWRCVKRLRPIVAKIPWLKNLRLNFIFFHYCYIIGVSIVGSVYLYPGGVLSYTDALFLAAGSATQSGLNTVNLNNIHTYQQVWLWLGSMIANPIVIHSFVVFVRLYWFGERFEDVVRRAKDLRRTRSMKSKAPVDDAETNRAEMGVHGRRIEVVRNAQGETVGNFIDTGKQLHEMSATSSTTSATAGQDESREPTSEAINEVPDTSDPLAGISADTGLRSSSNGGHEPHIAFVENQRRETRALRIPSPREFDRGGMPQSVGDEGNELARRETVQSAENGGPAYKQPSAGQHITIDEPDIIRPRRTTTFNQTNTRGSTDPTSGRDGNDEPTPAQRKRSRRGTFSSAFSLRRAPTQPQIDDAPYLSFQPTIARNSAFVGLTEEQRNELGGIEYRALKTLAVILVSYFVFFHTLGIVSMVPWTLHTHYGKIVDEAGVGRAWWAVFTSGSSFNDQGFILTPDSLISFSTAIFPVLLLAFLIIIGNTAFPCMLRFIIWSLSKLVPRTSALYDELRFLLDHPRRCFTLLFPASATWWLFWVVVGLNVTDLVLFLVLDVNDPDVTKIPIGIRFVDGLFEAATTRTAGSTVLNVATLHPAVQVSYMIMMYISIYPIAISLRRTNVYEEKSLGVYTSPEEESEAEDSKEPSYVSTHLRRQLSFDIWYIFLGLFVIAIIEGSRIETNKDYGFSLFAILFEVVSAYGTVGLSLGYPGTDPSFSAQFKTLSKLVIIAMMVRGRHRGLPYSVDRAILLPSEALHEKEQADAEKRQRGRRGSAVSGMSSTAPPGQITTSPGGLFRPDTGLSSGQDHTSSMHGADNSGSPSHQRGPSYVNPFHPPTRLATHVEHEPS